MGISAHLDRLAAFEPTPFPVVSLYLNLQPDQHGRANYGTYVRKEFRERRETFAPHTPERDSLDRDLERLEAYLRPGLDSSANGLALFACAAENDFFDTIQLQAPIDRHLLVIADQPHLYPLARLDAQYPRYAAVLTDTHTARIFVFATGEVERRSEVLNTKTRRTKMGGWSQARYQRHADNFHLQHAKEVVDTLDRIVREEGITHIVLACDEVVLPILRGQLPAHLNDKVIDVLHLDIRTPEQEVLAQSLDALRREDARTDRAMVEAAVGGYRSGGLGVVGFDRTRLALEMGQVDELLLSAAAAEHRGVQGAERADLATADDRGARAEVTATQAAPRVDRLIAKARQTAAKICFIEDGTLLAPFEGVAAILRFRVS